MYPEHITDNPRAGVLELVWRGRLPQQLSHAFLRSRCQCSACRSGCMRSGELPVAAPELRISEIRPVGAYGLQFVFSDDHDRGIYPWPYLWGLVQGDGADPQQRPD